MKRIGGIVLAILIVVALLSVSAFLVIEPSVPNNKSSGPSQTSKDAAPSHPSQDSLIAEMIQQIDEKEIRRTVYTLQNFTTRYYGSPGNRAASTYLYDRLNNISGLTVEYQGGEFRNVIATLPGRVDPSSIDMVGAHYDSISRTDYNNAPGATDNGGGVAIVLELARIMSRYTFNHTVKFALWNAEEGGIRGSNAYVKDAVAHNLGISSYFNFDSACYDPDDRLILDVMYNDRSQVLSDLVTQNNAHFNIGFNLTYNVHDCSSDQSSFWNSGYAAVMTHAETHGPGHSSDDTVDKVSTIYAKKNGQLGMSVLAMVSGVGPKS